MSRAHESYAWKKVAGKRKALAEANGEYCVRCHRPIDYTLHPNHRDGATIDHLDALAAGGDLVPSIELLGPAHRHCNSRHGQFISEMRKGSAKSLGRKSSTPRKGENTRSQAPGTTKSVPEPPDPSAIRCDVNTPFTKHPRKRPPNAALPLIFPPPHPEAVGSHGDHAAAWIEARMASDRNAEGDSLLWWQWLVLQRSQEYRADGSMCWPMCLQKAPRQQGKSVLLTEMAMWRAANPHLFGEVQRVLHAARVAALADQQQMAARLWAEGQGLGGSRRKADSFIEWPDGSYWHVMAMGAVWGQRVGLALLDEGWDLQPAAFWNGLWPAMAQRKCRQAWVFSASNEGDRGLMASMQRSPYCLVMVWGAPADADPTDERTWHAASPHMTPERLEAMRIASTAPGFRVEWLNVQPVRTSMGWLPEWDACGHAAGSLDGGIGAIEVSQDRSLYGTALAVRRSDGSADCWTGSHPTLEAAVEWLKQHRPRTVAVSIGLADRVVGPWSEVQGSVKVTRDATPVMRDLVNRGLLRHDHSSAASDQMQVARVADTEYGELLSAKRSEGPIPTLKAVVWAAYYATLPEVDEQPEIW